MKLEDPSDVKEEIVRFYNNLLGSSPVHSTSNIDSLRSALPKLRRPSNRNWPGKYQQVR